MATFEMWAIVLIPISTPIALNTASLLSGVREEKLLAAGDDDESLALLGRGDAIVLGCFSTLRFRMMSPSIIVKRESATLGRFVVAPGVKDCCCDIRIFFSFLMNEFEETTLLILCSQMRKTIRNKIIIEVGVRIEPSIFRFWVLIFRESR